jgi:hypothetical protein
MGNGLMGGGYGVVAPLAIGLGLLGIVALVAVLAWALGRGQRA